MNKLFAFSMTLFWVSANLSAQILYDQTSSVVSGGIASQDFETASNQYDCMAADDFLIPLGEKWTIDSITVLGQYSSGASTTTGMRIIFYEDSSGYPGPFHSQYQWASDIDLNGDGDVTLIFDCPIQMDDGRYWMVAQAMKTFSGGGGQWYWTRDSLGSGIQFNWQNPPNGFSTGCTTFNTIANCVPNIPHNGVAFTIYGCSGGPTINPIGNDTSFCEGNSVLLDPGTGGLSNPLFDWSTGDSTQTLVANQTGDYRVSVTDPNSSCYSVSCMSIQVFPIPDSDISDTSICNGETTTFNAFAGNVSYLWHDSVTTGPFFTTGTQGYVIVEMTSLDNGCVGIDSAYLTVIPDPDPTLTGEPSIQVCKGDTAEIGTLENWTGYAWSTGSDSTVILVSTAGLYYLTVTTQEGCTGSDSIELVTIDPPTPEITIDTVQPGWGIRLDAGVGFSSYAWSTGSQQRRIIAASTGTFTVTVTDEVGCTGTAEIFVEITGIAIAREGQGVSVFPNPARDQLRIQLKDGPQGAVTLFLLDATGRTVRTGTLRSRLHTLDLKGLRSGYYTLHLVDERARRSLPVMIE